MLVWMRAKAGKVKCVRDGEPRLWEAYAGVNDVLLDSHQVLGLAATILLRLTSVTATCAKQTDRAWYVKIVASKLDNTLPTEMCLLLLNTMWRVRPVAQLLLHAGPIFKLKNKCRTVAMNGFVTCRFVYGGLLVCTRHACMLILIDM